MDIVERPMRLRVELGFTGRDTKVYDLETGDLLTNIISLNLFCDASGEPNELVLRMWADKSIVEGEVLAEIVTEPLDSDLEDIF